jgi:hypothetical protein
MLLHVAVGAEDHEVREGIVTPLAPANLMMDLEVFERSARLTLPPIPF